MKKQKIEELLDSDGNLIGADDYPTTGADREGDANNTTDYNARVHGQNYKNDFLGRFGFYFYEDTSHEKPAVVRDLMVELGSEEMAWKIMKVIKPHLEAILDELSIGEGIMNEGNVVEDKLVDKKDKGISKKRDSDKMVSKIEKVAGLLNKLNKDDLNKLVNLLELKK